MRRQDLKRFVVLAGSTRSSGSYIGERVLWATERSRISVSHGFYQTARELARYRAQLPPFPLP